MSKAGYIRYIFLSVGLLCLLCYLFPMLIFDFSKNFSWLVIECIIVALLFPWLLRVARTGVYFLRGLISLVTILWIALIFSEAVYDIKMTPVHHDAGEAFGLWLFYVAGATIAALLIYPLGYLGARALCRNSGDLSDSR